MRLLYVLRELIVSHAPASSSPVALGDSSSKRKRLATGDASADGAGDGAAFTSHLGSVAPKQQRRARVSSVAPDPAVLNQLAIQCSQRIASLKARLGQLEESVATAVSLPRKGGR